MYYSVALEEIYFHLIFKILPVADNQSLGKMGINFHMNT